MKVLQAIPDEPAAVNAAISHGVPLLQEDKRSAAAKAILTLSAATAGRPMAYAAPGKPSAPR